MAIEVISSNSGIIAILGYAFAIFLWRTGFKVYSLIYSLIWTVSMQTFMGPDYHQILYFLTWMNVGLIVIHLKMFTTRLRALFYGRESRGRY